MQRAAGAIRPRAGVLCMACAIAGVLLSAGASSFAEEPPREWIDSFTPDQKSIVFRSNMHGATHAYAVEIAPSSTDRR